MASPAKPLLQSPSHHLSGSSAAFATAAANAATVVPAASAGRHRRQSGRCSSRSLASSTANNDVDDPSSDVTRLQSLLESMPKPAPHYRVRKAIGQGTFSTVYLAESKKPVAETTTAEDGGGGGDCLAPSSAEEEEEEVSPIAVKHLVPTSSPDRILMEVECLRLSAGECNVIPLLFCHRLKGDVVLAMPYLRQAKFGEVIRTITYREMVCYMKNLLVALAHIHSLGIIHRDIKPANFLFDFAANKYGLVDFGLAQMTAETVAHRSRSLPPPPPPPCKRKLTSSDLEDATNDHGGFGSPSGNARKRSRPALTNKTSEMTGQKPSPALPRSPRTPTRNYGSNPAYDFYDRRGSLRRTTPLKSKLEKYQQQEVPQQQQDGEQEPDYSREVTPRKGSRAAALAAPIDAEVRRSPRKHPQAVSRKQAGFSKLTISGSAIVGSSAAAAAASASTSCTLRRTPSFTILDPTSGIPSADYTPRLQASLTSRSFNSSSTVRFNTPTLIDRARCECYGLPKLCSKCTGRRSQKAARAGTPGFRPPEVLLKSEHQTTAVDMWAAGVIMLCILSRTYPFFRAPDDLTALAEILSLFGTEVVRETACQYGKKFLCSEKVAPVDLGMLCSTLASREGGAAAEGVVVENLVTNESVDLLGRILKLLSHERMTAAQALRHPMFKTG